jgi:hypothetical protein
LLPSPAHIDFDSANYYIASSGVADGKPYLVVLVILLLRYFLREKSFFY